MIAAFGMLVLARCHRGGDAVSALRILGVHGLVTRLDRRAFAPGRTS
jgi:hypothetical protein